MHKPQHLLSGAETHDRISHKCMEAILGWELTCDVFVGDWSQGWTPELQLARVKYDALLQAWTAKNVLQIRARQTRFCYLFLDTVSIDSEPQI